MARLRDIKVGMKVQIMKGSGNPDFFTTDNIGLSGLVMIIDNNDSLRSVLVGFPKRPSEWYPASWIKIIKDKGETKMTKPKIEVKPQKYILIDEEYVSQVFTDASTKGILNVSNDVFDERETVERLKEGKMKLFKIEEVKVEVTEPSIKIVG
jgi:hypothetical protein